MSAQGDSIFLTIGYHQLEGKRLPLKKPLAVLERSGSCAGAGYKVRRSTQKSLFYFNG